MKIWKRLTQSDEKLWKVFWLYFMLIGTIINIVVKVLIPQFIGLGILFYVGWVIRTLHIFVMTYFVWINAANASWTGWKYISRSVMVLVCFLDVIRWILILLFG